MNLEATKKGSKSEKKLQKKIRKKILNLLKGFTLDDNIKVSSEPSCCLYVGNSGMLCGYTRESIMKLFNPHGLILKLIMIPNKSFSFLEYKTIEAAMCAMESLQNYSPHAEVADSPRTPFLIQYLNMLPSKIDVHRLYPTVGKCIPINGLMLVEEFIDKQLEQQLIDFFQSTLTNDCHGTMKHRSVTHYGYEFLYGSNNIDKRKPLDSPIPSICDELIQKLLDAKIITFKPDQLTVNQYDPGQGIPPHIDTHSAFEDGIVSLSLNSQVTMEFAHPNGEVIPILLPQRSLLCMKEESRYLWTHGIIPRKSDIVYAKEDGYAKEVGYAKEDGDSVDSLTLKERGRRISLTFRKILHVPCRCIYHTKCDSYVQKHRDKEDSLRVPMSCDAARNLESEHVHNVYEEIAEHFSGTRHSPWPRVKEFLSKLPNGSFVADIGCGNGKYLGVNANITTIGSDRSANLCQICKQRGFPIIQSDIMKIPFRNNTFDACICIAVIHHLSTSERRLDAFKELLRIVKVDGLVLAYVWAIEQAENENTEIKTNSVSNEMVEQNSYPVNIESAEQNSNSVNIETTEQNSNTINIGSAEQNSNSVNIESAEQNSNSVNIKSAEQNSNSVYHEFEEQSGNSVYNEIEEQSGNYKTPTTSEQGDDKICVSAGRNIFQQQDLLVPWHLKGSEDKVFHRFYHVFKEGELKDLCAQLPCVELVDLYFDKGNWCVILKRTE